MIRVWFLFANLFSFLLYNSWHILYFRSSFILLSLYHQKHKQKVFNLFTLWHCQTDYEISVHITLMILMLIILSIVCFKADFLCRNHHLNNGVNVKKEAIAKDKRLGMLTIDIYFLTVLTGPEPVCQQLWFL